MDVKSVTPTITTAVARVERPEALSIEERKPLEAKYSDLLLKHTQTTPSSAERRKVRQGINVLAAQLGFSKEKVRADISYYERTKRQVRSIRADRSPDSRFTDGNYFG